MIKINHLHKSFSALKVLDDVSCEISQGMVTAILGPNASGKSTLIKCILGLVTPDRAEILIKGASIRHQHAYRSIIGYMPQIARFPDNLKVKELFAMIRDLRRDVWQTDGELLDSFNIESFSNKPLRVLSGGTRQKINAALAFLFCPEILILDEPTSGLDPIASTRLKDKIRKEKHKGKTVILSSHILSEIEELADHIIFLLEGRILFQGTQEDLKAKTEESRLERAVVKLMEKSL